MAELNSDGDDNRAWLTADELTVYISSNRPGGAGGYDVYVSVRETLDTPFDAPALLGGISTSAHEYWPAVTADGLTMYCTRYDALVDSSRDIYVASRDNLVAEFGDLEIVSVINSLDGNDNYPWISGDGAMLYFELYGNLYTSELQPNGSFAGPDPIAELNMGPVKGFPVPSDDALTMFFASDRIGAGGSDIWMAQRSAIDDDFVDAEAVTELNSVGDDSPSWLSSDGCRLYFVRSSAPAVPDLDIYVAERTP